MSVVPSDITGLQSLDPAVSLKAKQIEKMPPDQAINFLLSNGVDARTAGLVMKNVMLKKQAQQAKQAQVQPTTVAQDLDSHINSIAAAKARQAGIGGLPVSSSMFSSGDNPQGMAGGGLVAFDDGGPVPTSPGVTDYTADQQAMLAQNMIAQQQNAQAQAMAQQVPGMAKGGIAHFAGPDGSDVQGASHYAYSWQDPNSPDYIGPQPQPNASAQGMMSDPLFARMLQMQQPYTAGIKPPQPPAPPQPPPQAATPPPPPPPKPAPMPSQQQQAQAATQTRMPSIPQNFPNPLADLEAKQQADVDEARPMSEDQHAQQLIDTAAKQGIGQAAQQHLQELDQRKQVFQQMAQQGKWQALAQAGFAMAQAATTNPHAGFIGALAVGGQKGAEEYGKTLAQYHANMAQLQDAQYQVQQNQEAVKLGLMKQGNDDYKNDVTRYDNLKSRRDATTIKAQEQMYGREITAMTTKAQMASRMQYSPEVAAYQDQVSRGVAPMDALKAVRGVAPQVQAADVRNQGVVSGEGIKWLASPERMLMEHQAKNDPTKAAQLQAIDRQYGVPVTGAPASGLPPGWSVTPKQ
jgi:hypothetical protein